MGPDYSRAHRYLLSPDSGQWLRREAPFVLALIEAPGSRLTQYARGLEGNLGSATYPVQVEVGHYNRVTLPLAMVGGTTALTAFVTAATFPVAALMVFGAGIGLAAGALWVGRNRTEEWILGLDVRAEEIQEIVANAQISHDVPSRLMRMADYMVLTADHKYFWDQATYRAWERSGSPSHITTYGLTATVNGRPKEGEALRALQVI
ncbi:MAG TPA: hypothetical protein VEI97_16535 [bacterium]|nr:hypothetical protein [bacterium]